LGRILSYNKQWERYEKNKGQLANAVIAVIQEMKERLGKKGIEKNKIYVLPNTIEKEDADNSKARIQVNKVPNNLIIIYTGKITYHRGLDVVVDALEMLSRKYQSIEFWVVGGESYQNHIIEKAKAKELEQFMKFFGQNIL